MGGKSNPRSRRAEKRERERKRRRLLIVGIPLAVLVLVVAISVGVAAGKGGKDVGPPTDVSSGGRIDVNLPTSSPSWTGEYFCPIGAPGPRPTRGCAGYVTCGSRGNALGEPINCPAGTLFDAGQLTCTLSANVECETKADAGFPSVPTDLAAPVRVTGKPTPRPVTISLPQTQTSTDEPPAPPPAPAPVPEFVQTVDTAVQVGPIVTSGHRIAFFGITSPGEGGRLRQSLQNYLNIFYSRVFLNSDDGAVELRALSDVRIEIVITDFDAVERGRALRGGGDRRRLKSLIAVFDQTTSYKTTDPSITLGTVIGTPFAEPYRGTLVQMLKNRSPNIFADLEDVVFVEGGGGVGGGAPTTPAVGSGLPPSMTGGNEETGEEEETAVLTGRPTGEPTVRPTARPTRRPVEEEEKDEEKGEEKTPPPTPEPTPDPTPRPTRATPRPTRATPRPTSEPTPSPTPSPTKRPVEAAVYSIQGLVWTDTDRNGLYDNMEPLMYNEPVNIRRCGDDGNVCKRGELCTWVKTEFTDGNGQYAFDGIEGGEYFIEFFLPEEAGPGYGWTIPGRDESRLDSDVVYNDDEGRRGMTSCFTLDEDGLKFNAGYVRVETRSPTPSPTKRPVEEESPQFCAKVKIEEDIFDFLGCALPCRKTEECPEGTFCAYTDDCGPG
mmetsp:Transcript_24128/g.57211  ORF Transcript_24128/g.57211 Transcript_24128/m.57211 type:complete len:664 (-) Transcript_24128:103-2094(-)